MEVLADLHRVVAKLKSGGREGWANGIARHGQSGTALMLSPTHQQGAMPEPGITCSGGQEDRTILSPSAWVASGEIYLWRSAVQQGHVTWRQTGAVAHVALAGQTR